MRERMSRFVKYMQIKRLNDNQVTAKCGLSQGLLSQARTGKSDLGIKTINAILDTYQDLNRTWLLTGEGEMLKTTMPEVQTDALKVPLLNLDVRGGYDGNIELSDEWVERYVIWDGARKGDFAVQVSGYSMMPNIMPGSFVLLRAVPEWRRFIEFNILYVIELTDERRLLKLVNKSDKGEDYLKLQSFNPDTPDQELPVEVIRRVYKVVGQMTSFGF